MSRRDKKAKRPNILELSDAERIELIRKAKETLREKVVEAKLWRSFVEAGDAAENGHSAHRGDTNLKGFVFNRLSHAA